MEAGETETPSAAWLPPDARRATATVDDAFGEAQATRTWSDEDLRAIEEARTKLERTNRAYMLVLVAGLAATLASFVLSDGGIVFVGAIIWGAMRASDAQSKLRRLDGLEPGALLSAAVLGVPTSMYPRPKSNRAAVIVLGVLIALVVGFIVVAFAVAG